MKNGFKLINGLFWSALSLMLLPVLSFGDTIVLKDGQTIEAENISEREGNIFFYMQGLKMCVSKAAVLRVTKTTDKATPKAPLAIKENKAKIKPRSKPARRAEKKNDTKILPGENRPAKTLKREGPEIRWSGFRDLRWAAGRLTLGLLKQVETGTVQDEIKEYVRVNEDLKMGKAQLDSIVYAFWRNKLYGVTIWVSGHENYLALRNEVFNRFGIGNRSDPKLERYLWSDADSDRMLKYDEANQSGLFWMRSKELNRLHRLSQIKIPSTYIKAMEASALRAR